MGKGGRRLVFAAAVLLAAASLVSVSACISRATGNIPPQGHQARGTDVSAGVLPGTAAAASLSWTRTLEPAVLAGAGLADFAGAPLDELYVYSYRGGAWEQVPFQFDEVDASGTYTVVNSLLDAVDELTFMAGDLGDQASPDEWIDDAASKTHPRFEVRVTNPLNPVEEGWAYLYRSSTLVPGHPDYVQWDGDGYRIEAGSYAIGMDPPAMTGIATLELNGSGVDVLDRMKIRAAATCYIGPLPISIVLSEEDLADLVQLVPSIDGDVRVGGGTTSASAWFYRSTYRLRATFDTGGFEPPDFCTALTIDSLRESMDWLDPSASGMAPATYYDDNTPAGVPVDGVPDPVPALPLDTWSQVSGSRGSIVTAMGVSLGVGTISNYYLDDSTVNGDDTGDQRSYGDAGFYAEDPGGLVEVDSSSYVLDPQQPNLGALYRSYQANPLVATATAQAWQPACEPVSGADFAWIPQEPAVGEPVTFSATALGTPPITFAWDLGDGTTAGGPAVTHAYTTAGSYSVALTAANACGQQVVQKVIVVAETHRIFLPVLLYNAP